MIAEAKELISTKTEEEQTLMIEQASLTDIDGLIELMYLKRPTAWIVRISRGGLKNFLEYSIDNPRCVVLMARSGNDNAAGYIFSTIDTSRFWLGFALKHPVNMLAILCYRLQRIIDRSRQRKDRVLKQDGNEHLPAFSWSANSPGSARIIGLFVNREQRGKGIATKLYNSLFEELKKKKCVKVEEYMGPDYEQFAGKFHNCGWNLQKLSDAGYKLTKYL